MLVTGVGRWVGLAIAHRVAQAGADAGHHAKVSRAHTHQAAQVIRSTRRYSGAFVADLSTTSGAEQLAGEGGPGVGLVSDSALSQVKPFKTCPQLTLMRCSSGIRRRLPT